MNREAHPALLDDADDAVAVPLNFVRPVRPRGRDGAQRCQHRWRQGGALVEWPWLATQALPGHDRAARDALGSGKNRETEVSSAAQGCIREMRATVIGELAARICLRPKIIVLIDPPAIAAP